MRLSCVCAEDAEVEWRRGEEVLQDGERFRCLAEGGLHTLEILQPDKADTGEFSCSIVKFGRSGESTTSCQLEVIGEFWVNTRELH